MSTRALVGVIDEIGNYRARYVHNDGYPDHMGPALAAILTDRSRALVDSLATIMAADWSVLDPDITYESPGLGAGSAALAGFGQEYVDSQLAAVSGRLGDPVLSRAEWAYFLTEPHRSAELAVCREHAGRLEWVTVVPLSQAAGMSVRQWLDVERLPVTVVGG